MEKTTIKEENTPIKIIKGVGIALLITLISLLIFSIILTYTNIEEKTISPVIMIITAISILIGSSIENSKIKKNGLINGGIIGGIYILILYAVSSILNWKFSLNINSVIMIVAAIIFGILGGIIGVNRRWNTFYCRILSKCFYWQMLICEV